MRKSFEMVVLAVSQKWPVLLYGPAGAGKSALINKLALDSGNQGISFLFLSLLQFNGTPPVYTFWSNPSQVSSSGYIFNEL
jgi:GTPase SAR1 family protein